MELTSEQRNEQALQGVSALAGLLRHDLSASFPSAEERRPALIGWGLVTALRRQAQAVVALHREGLGHEAAPNRRLMIEYVAQLHWLAQDREQAVDSMNRAFQYTHGKLRAAVDKGGIFAYDGDIAAAADAVAGADIPPNAANQYSLTAKLLERLGHGLLEVWTSETQLSHSGLMAARVFFDDSAPDAVLLHDAPHFGESPEAFPFVAFMLLYVGMEAFNDLLVGSPWTDELQQVGRECGLVILDSEAGSSAVPADLE